MDINRLSNIITDTQSAGMAQRTSNTGGNAPVQDSAAQSNKAAEVSDKVSIDSSRVRNEAEFAKTELDKLSRGSFDKVRAIAKQNYRSTKNAMKFVNTGRCDQNDLRAAKLNDPAVGENIPLTHMLRAVTSHAL